MVSVAGKPIIGHILDRLIEINPEEVIIVVGYINYLNKFNKISFVHQKQRLGLGHSIYVCMQHVMPLIQSLNEIESEAKKLLGN